MDIVNDVAATASGATLGFITGFPNPSAGAILGGYVGYKLSRISRMAKVSNNNARSVSRSQSRGRKRHRGPLVTPGTSLIRRTPSRSNSIFRSRSRSTVRFAPGVSRGGMNVGATTVIHSTGKKRKRVKQVRVSKTLRKKIQKVMTAKALKGQTQEISYGVFRWIDELQSNKQIVVDFTALASVAGDPLFSHYKIIDAASVLWNEKAQAANKTITTGNFTDTKLKINVVSSSVIYTFRNNTQRDANMKILEVRPTSGQVAGDPFAIWIAALVKYTQFQGANQNSTVITELHTHPMMLPQFRKLFKVNTIDIHIPPGGTYLHTVQGPALKTFECTKMWNGTTWQNYHPECCWMIAMYCPDLVTTTNGLFGRFINPPTLVDGQYQRGIVWEAVHRYKLEMPEMAGFINPSSFSASTVQELGQRQWSFAYKTYADALGSGRVVRIDDEDPTVAENPE